ncbi:hypothetical protein ACM1PE_25140 [Achromobacter sp. PD1]|uniref:hypothetical protein n=1 Tax=Achromobacter sp. PD1 TaxID=3399125 RepID=UPI003AF7DDDA
MMIALHKNARTTPAIRAEIAASGDSAAALAQRFGITEATVYKWKKRTSVHDASHTPHRLQTTLTPAQERVVVELRRTLLLPLDDLLAVTREFICPKATRSGLDRCLRRHGVGNLGDLKPAQPAPVSETFKAYEPGYLHVDLKYLPQMQDENSRRYLFVAIDRATRWVFVQIKKNKTAASAKAFLNGVLSRNRRKFRQPINVACPAPGRWGRPNSRVTSRHFDHGNASRTSRPDCSGLDEAD